MPATLFLGYFYPCCNLRTRIRLIYTVVEYNLLAQLCENVIFRVFLFVFSCNVSTRNVSLDSKLIDHVVASFYGDLFYLKKLREALKKNVNLMVRE